MKALMVWARKRGIALNFSRAGKPTDNAFIESFNGKFRNERLNRHWFMNMAEAGEVIEAWRKEYNEVRPHSSLGYMPPAVFAKRGENGVKWRHKLTLDLLQKTGGRSPRLRDSHVRVLWEGWR